MTTTRFFTLGILLISCASQFAAAAPAPAPSAPVPPPPLPGSIDTHPEWPALKNPRDADTIEHLIASLYDVISGPAGKPRDWARFRALFLPDGRLGVIRPDSPAKADQAARQGDAVFRTPDMYAERNGPYFKRTAFLSAESRTGSRNSATSCMFGAPMRAGMPARTRRRSPGASTQSKWCMLGDATG